MTKLAIINGRLADPAGDALLSGSILIEGDRIVAAGDIAVPADAERIDAQGQVVAPGLVDLGVFATDKPAFHFGGITRAALMPDQSSLLDDAALIRQATRAGKPDFWVHPIAAATRGLKGTELAEIGMMQAAGAKAVGTGRQWIADSGVMLRVLSYAAGLGLTVIAHAEDGGLAGKAVATSGETATRLGLPHAPACAEAMAIARDIMLARQAGAAIHFRLVTTRAGFDLIRAAKAEGLRVSCGISPAYLFLADNAVTDFRTFARLSPPLRSEDDRKASIAAVADGTVDVITSSHDPRGAEDKRLPFADASPGMAGAETLLALSLNLVRDGHVSLNRLMTLLSANPARILGVNAGSFASGSAADLIFVDPDAPWIVDSGKMAAAAGNTPFDRVPVQGRARRIMKGGVFL
ncbi:MAG: dihydroorotase [Sphingobium sp.]|uniref:Dihydroorotase n=1 Tax=Sphingobium xenophagum TaxID=121428 RepID=A0A249MU36_SPHXE|nr:MULTISPECIES: dihydroorotase [Sphingobium]MBU1796672.1 dihydroorotase [Alphaproteobacteria bacterium]ASY44871.1 dihydroorotase [Sphingobium xenophagum]MBA4753772.1 dihydroorotase [Sphingobium sp.]MBS88344.1 dihydroorotase [Sphingobium sp.]MBU2014959.1 dihydroorotase [Alphaproteobacteria bacterium]